MTNKVQFMQTLRLWMDVFMSRSMRGFGRFAKSTGLSMPQFSVIMQLHYHGPSGMSDLGTRFGVTPAAASQMVDKLVQHKLIAREEDPNDRRAKLLQLTDEGKKVIQQGLEGRYLWMDQLVDKLTPEERAQVNAALTILIEKAQELDSN